MKSHYRYYITDKRDKWITKVQKHWYLLVIVAGGVVIFAIKLLK